MAKDANGVELKVDDVVKMFGKVTEIIENPAMIGIYPSDEIGIVNYGTECWRLSSQIIKVLSAPSNPPEPKTPQVDDEVWVKAKYAGEDSAQAISTQSVKPYAKVTINDMLHYVLSSEVRFTDPANPSEELLLKKQDEKDTPRVLKMGEIVHFVREDGYERAAIVTRVTSLSMAICIFDPNEGPINISEPLPYNPSKGPRTWHWPD